MRSEILECHVVIIQYEKFVIRYASFTVLYRSNRPTEWRCRRSKSSREWPTRRSHYARLDAARTDDAVIGQETSEAEEQVELTPEPEESGKDLAEIKGPQEVQIVPRTTKGFKENLKIKLGSIILLIPHLP